MTLNMQKSFGQSKCPCITFGVKNKADIYAEDIVTYADRVEFTVKTPWFGGLFVFPADSVYTMPSRNRSFRIQY